MYKHPMLRIAVLVGLFGVPMAHASPAKKPSAKVMLLDSFADQDATLTAKAVARKVMSSFGASIRRCYSPVADLSGTLELRFAVTKSGTVASQDASSFDEPLENCIRAAMSKWTFAKPKLGGQPITATFKLVIALDSTGRSQKEVAADIEAEGVASLTDGGDGDADTSLAGTHTSSSSPSNDDRPFTPELVLAKIQSSYVAGLRRCYNRAPRAGLAHLVLAFDVDASGATKDTRVRGAYRRLRSCMKSQVAKWSFPAPPDAPAHFEVPFTM